MAQTGIGLPLIDPWREQGGIQTAGRIGPRRQVTHAQQQRRIPHQQRDQHGHLHARARIHRQHAHHCRAQCNALQHTPYAEVMGMQCPPHQQVQQHAGDGDAQCAFQHATCKCRPCSWIQRARCDAEGHRHAHQEQEEREHQVGRCATVPFGMAQRCEHRTPVTGVVDQQHRRHGHAAQGVDRAQPAWRRAAHRQAASYWPAIHVPRTCSASSSSTRSAW
ncbi:hypothetical protein D3C81_302910 [compost metagenome]